MSAEVADIEGHERQHRMLLGTLERPALMWLAARQPRWVGPDTLTAVGVLGAAMICGGYALTRLDPVWLWLVNLGFLVNWYGDSLDGTLARYRKAERPRYGFFIDHTVDAFNEFLIISGIGLSPFVRLEVALLALVGYLLLSVFIFVRTAVSGVFQISYGRIGPTELRVIVVLFNIAVFAFGDPRFEVAGVDTGVLEAVVAVVAVAMIVVFVVVVLREAVRLAREESRASGLSHSAKAAVMNGKNARSSER